MNNRFERGPTDQSQEVPGERLTTDCEILVYGGTVSGIAAALGAARKGRKTLLLERGSHWGGMTASGLGVIDTMREEAFGGIMAELLGHVRTHYRQQYGEDSDQYRLTYGGYFMEPHVAESILTEMLASQANLTCMTECELVSAVLSGKTLTGSVYTNRSSGEQFLVRHKVAIDGTYEGDLAAAAGVAYRIGRESRSEHGEKFAGVIYYDWRSYKQEILPQSTGEASDFIQAYCFRLTLSGDPKNRIPFSKPAAYSDFYSFYKCLNGDFQSGRVRDVKDILWLNPISNGKYVLNGHIEALTSANIAELSTAWPDANWTTRDSIFEQYKEYTQGLMYFLQNDPAIPKVPLTEASIFGLPEDEYTDSQNFPWQLYVRQGRRIIGEYLITEHDSMPVEGRGRPHIHKDAICTYEHRFDCHPARNRGSEGATVKASDGFELLEGTIFFRNRLQLVNYPATIPYRAIVPETVDGLLVPAALSATHVAFTAIRMEPVWMSTGLAAGIAAAMAVEGNIQLRAINISGLQRQLVQDRQVIVYFNNLLVEDPMFEQLQLEAISRDYADFDVTGLRATL